ncbi:MAG: helix-turn-helix domain-containing protein [Clostridia bacterium]|nr:helix-turn-helix domain-containing protein [Clostridia bacterium]
MDSYGKTIARLRKENGLTQNELGAQLNVTYQAVSKWENDLSQPDFDTIIALCKIFKISVDDFTRLSTGEEVQTETAAAESAVAVGAGDAAESSAAEAQAESAEQTTEIAPPAVEQGNRKRRCSISAGYLIGLICAVLAGVGVFTVLYIFTWWPIAIVAGYMVLSFIALMGHESVVWDVLLGGLTKSVNIPGVIFTLDLDGIFFLIVYKFIIAPLATVVIWLVFAIGSILLSFLMSGFIFPFKIPRIIKDTFFKK